MRKPLLFASALCAVGLWVSIANAAAPAAGILESLKATASEASAVQQVRYYHHRRHYRRYGYRQGCWWQDRYMCRYFW